LTWRWWRYRGRWLSMELLWWRWGWEVAAAAILLLPRAETQVSFFFLLFFCFFFICFSVFSLSLLLFLLPKHHPLCLSWSSLLFVCPLCLCFVPPRFSKNSSTSSQIIPLFFIPCFLLSIVSPRENVLLKTEPPSIFFFFYFLSFSFSPSKTPYFSSLPKFHPLSL
jgi:hypothetical protein